MHYTKKYLKQLDELKKLNQRVKDADKAGNIIQRDNLTKRFKALQEQMRNG